MKKFLVILLVVAVIIALMAYAAFKTHSDLGVSLMHKQFDAACGDQSSPKFQDCFDQLRAELDKCMKTSPLTEGECAQTVTTAHAAHHQ